MTYDEIIEQLEITKSKIKEIARNEYGGESWNDDLDALTEAADIVADYSKATAQASEMSQKYERPAQRSMDEDGRRQAPVPAQQRDIYIQRPGSRAETFRRSHQAQDPRPWNQ